MDAEEARLAELDAQTEHSRKLLGLGASETFSSSSIETKKDTEDPLIMQKEPYIGMYDIHGNEREAYLDPAQRYQEFDEKGTEIFDPVVLRNLRRNRESIDSYGHYL